MTTVALTYNLKKDETVEEVEKRFRDVFKECDDYLLTREVGTQYGHHWHGAVRTRKKSIETFRSLFKKVMGITAEDGRGKMYSIKKWDNGPKYLRYCCKGPTGSEDESPVVVFNSGFNTSLYHKEFFEERRAVLEEHEERKRLKKKKPTLRDRFLDLCAERGVSTRDDIVRLSQEFLEECGRNKERCYVSAGMLVQWYNAAFIIAHPVSATDDVVKRAYEMWTR